MVSNAIQRLSKTLPHNGELQSLIRHPRPSVAVSLLTERVSFVWFNNASSTTKPKMR